MSKNYRALNRADRATQMIWYGLIATGVVLWVAFLLPDGIPNMVVPLIYSYAIYGYVSAQLGRTIQEHFAAGGARGSWWHVIGVGLLSALIVLGALFALALAFPSLV